MSDAVSQLLGLSGKAFVLMGRGEGLGLAIARHLTAAGARVLCLDQNPAMAELVAKETGAETGYADALDRESLAAAFDDAERRLGPLHGVVDIIGMAMLRSLEDFDDDLWDRQFDIIVRHAFLALQTGAAKLTGGGSFTFVGSLAGERAVKQQVVYGAAKAALHQLVRGAAQEFGPRGLRVNAIAPGFVRTPRLEQILSAAQWGAIEGSTPLGRAARPSDIAGGVLFLASDLAAIITGQVLLADGGISVAAALPDIEWTPRPAS